VQRPDHVVFFGSGDLRGAVCAGSGGLAFDQSHGFWIFWDLGRTGKSSEDSFIQGARWRQSLGWFRAHPWLRHRVPPIKILW
jgi:hypothetical protein